MRAVHVAAAGQKPALSDLVKPTPAAGEVLVRIAAAALNPMDNALASGVLAGAMEHRYPLVLGRDAVGTIEELGASVTTRSIGEQVIVHIPFVAPFEVGTLAEFVVVPAASLALKPAGLSDVTAASIPLAGGAALAAVDASEAKAGDVVLVNGASGAVGRLAVQLLARRGATVVATASTEASARLIELGADHAVDYSAGSVAEQVRALYPQGVDALVNLWGNTADDVPLGALKPGARVSTIVSVPDAQTTTAAGFTGGGIVIASPDADVLGRLAQSVDSGELLTDVTRVISLEEAPETLQALAEGRVHGKVVVEIV